MPIPSGFKTRKEYNEYMRKYMAELRARKKLESELHKPLRQPEPKVITRYIGGTILPEYYTTLNRLKVEAEKRPVIRDGDEILKKLIQEKLELLVAR